MWELLIPAALGLLIKSFFLYSSMDSLEKNMFTAMLAISALHSLIELTAGSAFFLGKEVELLLRVYYVISVWWLGFALLYVFEVLEYRFPIKLPIIVIATVISSLFLFTDLIISGYSSNGYAPTATKAGQYWIFQAFALGTILTSLLILVKKTFFSQEKIERQIQTFYLLTAFLSPFVAVFAVIVLMQFDINVNAMAIIPIATTMFVLLMIKSEQEHGLIDFRRFIPWSPERHFAKEMSKNAKLYSLNRISLKEAKQMNEAALIKYAVAISKTTSISEISRRFQVPTSTLYSLIDKHNLTINK